MPQQQIDYDRLAAEVKGVDYDALAQDVSAQTQQPKPEHPHARTWRLAKENAPLIGSLMTAALTSGASIPMQAVLSASAAVAGSRLRGDSPEQARTAGLTEGGITAAAGGAPKLVQGLAQRIYRGLLKPSKAVRQEFGDVVPELLNQRRLITRGGAEAAETAVEESANAADAMIANAPRPSPGVPANRVTREFGEVLDAVKARVDAGVVPASELDKVAQRVTRLNQTAKASGGRIDPVRAQTLKRSSQEAAQGAYSQMQSKNIKMLGTDDLLDAATARGFKGGLEDIVPGIGTQNQATQKLIGQSRALAEGVGRTSNHLPFGSVSDLAAMTAGAANPALGVLGKVTTMAGPGSAFSIGLNEAAKRVNPQTVAATRLLNLIMGGGQ